MMPNREGQVSTTFKKGSRSLKSSFSNRRGQVEFLLVVIVAIVLVGGALYTFASFGGGVKGQSQAYNDLALEVEFGEKYIVESAKAIGKGVGSKEGYMSKANSFEPSVKGVNIVDNNFFGKIRTGEFSFDGKTLIVENVFVKAEKGVESVRRDFDLKVVFENSEAKVEIIRS